MVKVLKLENIKKKIFIFQN